MRALSWLCHSASAQDGMELPLCGEIAGGSGGRGQGGEVILGKVAMEEML